MRLAGIAMTVVACPDQPSAPPERAERDNGVPPERDNGVPPEPDVMFSTDGPCPPLDTFRMYYGNPISRTQALEIEASGSAVFWSPQGNEHHFTVDAATIAALREELDRIGFCGLDERYPSDWQD